MNNEIITHISQGGWWINHLADMRSIYAYGKNQSLENAQRQLLMDLKIMSIFWGENLIVEDGDILNNLAFHKLFLDNSQYFRSLIDDGIIKIALRENVSGLGDLNELVKTRRLKEENYETVKKFCIFFDNYIKYRNIKKISWSVEDTSNYFVECIKRFTHAINSPLMPSEHEMLADLLYESEQKYGNLFAGNLLSIARSKNIIDNHNIIQAIRAARLARLQDTPDSIILPPNDIESSFVNFAVKRNFSRQLKNDSVHEYDKILPNFIPNATSLQALNFLDIREIMSIGKEIGYYDQLNKLIHARDGMVFNEEYIKFINSLNFFLKEIKIGFKLEYTNWQKAIIDKYVKDKSEGAYKKMENLITAIPLVATSTVLIAAAFFDIPQPISGISGVVGAASGVGKFLIDKKRKKNKSNLDNILWSHKTV